MGMRGPAASPAEGGSERGGDISEEARDTVADMEAHVRATVPSGPAMAGVVARARKRALDLLEIDEEAMRVPAAGAFAGEVVTGLWLEAPRQPRTLTALLEELGRISGTSPYSLAVDALTHPGVMQLPPDVALDLHVQLLLGSTGARHASVWLADARGRASRAATAGATRSPAGGRSAAEVAIAEAVPVVSVDRGVVAVPVLRWQQPQGALLMQPPVDGVRLCRPLMVRSAEMLGPVLERQALLAGGSRAEEAIMNGTDRRLARLGLDLHDGPLQSVIAMAHEIARCRDSLAVAVSEGSVRTRVGGWLGDLEAHLLRLEEELREYSGSLGSRGVLRQPLPEVLEQIASTFRSRSGIDALLDLSGDLGGLTQSQQIALARIVQEALNNVRVHSGATRVRVKVTATREHLRATVIDDGDGFDMERTLVRAAASGRLGLLGMDERVRLLGGTFRIRSREGGPTELVVTLPRWEPKGLPEDFDAA